MRSEARPELVVEVLRLMESSSAGRVRSTGPNPTSEAVQVRLGLCTNLRGWSRCHSWANHNPGATKPRRTEGPSAVDRTDAASVRSGATTYVSDTRRPLLSKDSNMCSIFSKCLVTFRSVIEARKIDAELLERIQPHTFAGADLLEVPEPLKPLFPVGGLQRGWSVGLSGHGAWSLGLALVASALGKEGWLAVVGAHHLNLAAAAELGVRLDRIVVIEDPGPNRMATVTSALMEAAEVVMLSAGASVTPTQARRLASRARERGTTLIHLGPKEWPTTMDITLTTVPEEWTGLGQGHGYLAHRRLRVDSLGRRAHGSKSVGVWLPGPNGGICS